VNEYPKWISQDHNENLREVARNVYVGAWWSTGAPPSPHAEWTYVVSLISQQSTCSAARKVTQYPMRDGHTFRPGVLDEICKSLAVKRQEGPVLIQCMAGMSRSASVAYAFLRHVDQLSPTEALRRVKAFGGPFEHKADEFPMAVTLASAEKWVMQMAPL